MWLTLQHTGVTFTAQCKLKKYYIPGLLGGLKIYKPVIKWDANQENYTHHFGLV